MDVQEEIKSLKREMKLLKLRNYVNLYREGEVFYNYSGFAHHSPGELTAAGYVILGEEDDTQIWFKPEKKTKGGKSGSKKKAAKKKGSSRKN